MLSLILMELLFMRFEKIPFTCSYLPGDASRVLLWPLYGLSFACYLLASTTLEAWLSGDFHRLIWFYAIFGSMWLALLYRNLLSAKGMVYFEEEPAKRSSVPQHAKLNLSFSGYCLSQNDSRLNSCAAPSGLDPCAIQIPGLRPGLFSAAPSELPIH